MSEADVEQLKAEIANLKGQMSAFAMSQTSGIDYMMGWSCQDDSEIPNVPIGGGSKPFEWDQKDKRILGGTVLVGRQALHLDASNGQMGDHDWAVKVTFTSSGATLEYCQWDEHSASTDEVTYLPLYRVKDGNVEEDWRDTFYVQCWE